ncbi:helix-turn-helix domain-containing protein [Microbacterium sp. 18062]|uniref:winged helix-turn-helix transcriptional regulator n=1 Tax=Microbacterium sp. 18062 TaxID=2681410 RepID=UPI00135ABF35|nr:helix-turn-helix domain-containing protein [Microbacterium sp. 18062]
MSKETTDGAATASAPDAALCPSFLAAMDILGKRWNGALIQVLRGGALRFVDLKSTVPGISDAVLTTRLGELLRCGLVERVLPGTGSTRGVYALTEKGRALLPVLDDLTAWSERWVPADAHRSSRS